MVVLKAQSGTRRYVEQFYRTLFILIEFFKGSPWSFFGVNIHKKTMEKYNLIIAMFFVVKIYNSFTKLQLFA